ncbi:MAG: hypothetical protein R3B82_25570 [Sandaracinaceae bacterium]
MVGNLSQLGTSSAWTVDPDPHQLQLVRDDPRAFRSIQYQIAPLGEDRAGVVALFREHHVTPATTPPIPGATDGPPVPGVVSEGSHVSLTGDGRCFAVYREDAGAFGIDRLVFGSEATLYRGRWAISLVARNGLESRGVVVEVTEGDPPPMGASCTHSFGGVYAHTACSASYQCCDGAWQMPTGACGPCLCTEPTGMTGCGL